MEDKNPYKAWQTVCTSVFQCARKTGSRGVWLAIQLKAMEGSIQLQCACLCFGNAEQKRIRRYRGNTIIHGRGIMTVPRGRTPDSALLFSRVARLDGEYQTIHHLYSGGNDWCSILCSSAVSSNAIAWWGRSCIFSFAMENGCGDYIEDTL